MKKHLKTILICFLIISVSGCKNKNLSDDVYDNCKTAINIVDDYLNKYIDAEEADDKLYEIECNDNIMTDDDRWVCTKILALKIDFSSFISSDGTTKDIIEEQEELKKMCGI